MSFPEEGTAEWWDGVARGYENLLATPPKFINPLIDRSTYPAKIKEAREKAAEIRRKNGTP